MVDITDEFHTTSLPDPDRSFTDGSCTDEELGSSTSWVKFFEQCEYKEDCVKLYRREIPAWKIRNRYSVINRQEDKYEYKHNELLLCLGALSDRPLNLRISPGIHQTCTYHSESITLREKCYGVSEFYNYRQ